jgi:glycosyltransferase involved in cell wall biosynthesis
MTGAGTLKVLFICHGHPSVRPGGTEAYAHEVFTAFRSKPGVEAIFLAKGGPPVGRSGNVHLGTFVAPVEGDPDQYLIYTDGYDYDWLNPSVVNADFYTKHVRDFLLAFRPDVVHIQHTQFLGYPIIREIRNTLPDAAVIYTLHEYLPICHNDGQMVRPVTGELCTHASPRRCHECFPSITPQAFFMRQRFIQAHLSLVDLFIAPSHFLLERYVRWGIPRERLRFVENGRSLDQRFATTDDRPFRNRFGFFGQLNPNKGVRVLLEAMRLVDTPTDGVRKSAGGHDPRAENDVSIRLSLHGANLELQPREFQEFVAESVHSMDSVTLHGRYDHAALAELMAPIDWVVVPSIWWENSPLVIQEAFFHRRPVICSDIGGMVEKVTDGVNGLQFRAGDASSLAGVMRRAASSPGLWNDLRRGIPDIPAMERHVAILDGIYRSALTERTPEVSSSAG